jgi:hypothetical protein
MGSPYPTSQRGKETIRGMEIAHIWSMREGRFSQKCEKNAK